MTDEVFTYDNIYDMLHSEKFNSELQSISNEDLSKISKYLQDKQRLLDKQEESTQIFSSQKRVVIQIEIDNALRALKDLYEFREKKIISRAVFSVRGGTLVKDTTNMLTHEIEFYNLLTQIIPQNRDAFFKLLEPGQDSIADPKIEEEEPTPVESLEPDDVAEPIKTVKVRFLEGVESFVAEDLKSYGPYSVSEEAELPEGIANLLMSKNKVELVKSEDSNEEKDEISKTSEDILPEVQETHTPANQTSEDQIQA